MQKNVNQGCARVKCHLIFEVSHLPIKYCNCVLTMLAIGHCGGGGRFDMGPALGQDNLRLELLQLGLQLSQFGVGIFDKVGDLGEALFVLSYLPQFFSALLDLQFLADFSADGLFNLLQLLGHRVAGCLFTGRVTGAGHAIFVAQLIQLWLPDKVALQN